MPPPLSTLGVFHTIATIIAIYVAIEGIIVEGRINLKSRSGKSYFILTSFGCLSTIWLVARNGLYGPGHFLSLLIMILLVLALVLEKQIERFVLFQAIALTTTLLFSLIPAVMETLTRLPLHAPFATGPDDTIVKTSLAILFLSFLGTLFWQVQKFKRT